MEIKDKGGRLLTVCVFAKFSKIISLHFENIKLRYLVVLKKYDDLIHNKIKSYKQIKIYFGL